MSKNSGSLIGFENTINDTFKKNQIIRVGTVDGSFTEGKFKFSENSVIALRKGGKDENTIIFLPNTWCVGPA
ncbi:hypothetical protein [Chengkuizengella sediminis]|uniref:hypothetical protein n=1 Tax=Chengkuizengella sediminis TaxID=1885917 RepID=UPI0013899B60|nr:hypothetical protein [Chengkuizengella sediminis]NDI35413.1 hypothetical protein [Chengkuizengella sediminis]